jgi:hypothetical protein
MVHVDTILLPAKTKKKDLKWTSKLLCLQYIITQNFTSFVIMQAQTEICYYTVDDNTHGIVSESKVCKYGMYFAAGREFY